MAYNPSKLKGMYFEVPWALSFGKEMPGIYVMCPRHRWGAYNRLLTNAALYSPSVQMRRKPLTFSLVQMCGGVSWSGGLSWCVVNQSAVLSKCSAFSCLFLSLKCVSLLTHGRCVFWWVVNVVKAIWFAKPKWRQPLLYMQHHGVGFQLEFVQYRGLSSAVPVGHWMCIFCVHLI